MATRSRKGSTARTRTSRRRARSDAAADGARARRGPGGDGPSRNPFFDDLHGLFDPAALCDPRHPFARVSSLLALQFLEWQSAALEVYRRALGQGVWAMDTDQEHVRELARGLMSAYLDLVKSAPERRERLLAGQADLARALSDAVDELRRRLTEADG